MNMPAWALAALARFAAVIAGAIITWIVNIVPGLDAETIEGGRKALEGGITFLGVVVFLAAYGVVRPWLSKRLHPSDTSGAGKPG